MISNLCEMKEIRKRGNKSRKRFAHFLSKIFFQIFGVKSGDNAINIMHEEGTKC